MRMNIKFETNDVPAFAIVQQANLSTRCRVHGPTHRILNVRRWALPTPTRGLKSIVQSAFRCIQSPTRFTDPLFEQFRHSNVDQSAGSIFSVHRPC